MQAIEFRRIVSVTLRLLVAALLILVIDSLARAAEPDFKIGENYKLTVERGTVTQKCDGTLVQVTPRWLVVREVTHRSTKTGIPYLMDMPVAGRLFSRSHDEKVEQNVWLPREAVIVMSHEAVTAPSVGSLSELDPPMNRRCFLTTATGGEQTRRGGSVVELTGNQLTLVADDASRQTIQRQHVLSLEFETNAASSKSVKSSR